LVLQVRALKALPKFNICKRVTEGKNERTTMNDIIKNDKVKVPVLEGCHQTELQNGLEIVTCSLEAAPLLAESKLREI